MSCKITNYTALFVKSIITVPYRSRLNMIMFDIPIIKKRVQRSKLNYVELKNNQSTDLK